MEIPKPLGAKKSEDSIVYRKIQTGAVAFRVGNLRMECGAIRKNGRRDVGSHGKDHSGLV